MAIIASDAAQSSGDVVRRLDEMERALRELAAGRRLEQAIIGSGGIKVRGGEIRIQTADGLTDLAVLSSAGIFFNGQPLLLPGSVSWFAGPSGSIPSGWLIANGAAVSRTTYAQLFATIGTTWGVGDGSTTFNLPDLRDRVPVGAGSTYSVGGTGGAATHTHAHSATHTHGHSATHTHAVSGSTGSGGSHTHSIPQGTDQTSGVGGTAVFTVSHQSHTHGGTNSGGSHTHSSATTDSAAPGTSDAAAPGTSDSTSSLPPYAALIPIIRT